ncbi:MAG: hypothetical protein K1X49_10255 [Saprospiraceae bacterium]|nr:hypothetical protein [Saprospiraceae bacterium]
MAVLVDIDIKKFVANFNLIENFEDSSLQGASYDMGVGSSYSSKGEVKVITSNRPAINIEPGEFIVLTSFESLNLPLNMTGHFGLTSYWGMRGLVPLFGPQIDPGFQGILVVPVFNAGDSPISMQFKEKMFTVEFIRTSQNASYGWAERNGKQTRIKQLHTAFETRPNLADISKFAKQLAKIELETQSSINLFLGKINKIESDYKITNTEITSSIAILQNRFSDVIEKRNTKLVWISIFIAVITLIVGIIFSGPIIEFFRGLNDTKP